MCTSCFLLWYTQEVLWVDIIMHISRALRMDNGTTLMIAMFLRFLMIPLKLKFRRCLAVVLRDTHHPICFSIVKLIWTIWPYKESRYLCIFKQKYKMKPNKWSSNNLILRRNCCNRPSKCMSQEPEIASRKSHWRKLNLYTNYCVWWKRTLMTASVQDLIPMVKCDWEHLIQD